MFTGLVEEIGVIKKINKGLRSAKLTIQAKTVLENVEIGDSINTNGVCLTVVEFDKNSFTVDVIPETMEKSNLKSLKVGSKVNLERALRMGDRLGGHIVSGHIDGIGTIKSFEEDDNATWISIKAPQELLRGIVYKGSVALDGTSLTIAYVDNEIFKVSIIPLTKDETILLDKKIGDEINIECDVVGKYIERFLILKDEEKQQKSNIDMDFLKENGFL